MCLTQTVPWMSANQHKTTSPTTELKKTRGDFYCAAYTGYQCNFG